MERVESEAMRAGNRAALVAAPWIEKLARIGYYAKGVVYVLLGILAVRAAIDMNSESASSTGVFRAVAEEPFGRILLFVIAVGLAGYTAWRAVQAIKDPEQHESGARETVARLFFAISAIVHGALTIQAFRIAFGRSAGNESASEQTAGIMSHPAGLVAIGAAGLAILGYGLYQLWEAWKRNFDERFALERLAPRWRSRVVKLSRFGTAARGVVFSIVGFFLLRAAIQHDPSEAKGVAGALQALESSPAGPWLALVVAAGLIAYGIFVFLKGRYRRIVPA